MGTEAATIFIQSHEFISKESDRGAIIISASILDERLKRLLISKLAPPKNNQDRLFEGANSPLGTFSAKIELAYRLSLINEQYYEILHLFRKIRNECAHNFENYSISSINSQYKLSAIYHKMPKIHTVINQQINTLRDSENFPRVEFDMVFSIVAAGIAALEHNEFSEQQNNPIPTK